MSEPDLFVTSTGTEVGKTVISILILHHWIDQGYEPVYWKPVASGCVESDHGYRSPDELEVLRHTPLEANQVEATYRFRAPRSPDVAAEKENRRIDIDPLLADYKDKQQADPVLIEGIGGVAVPLKEDWDVARFLGRLGVEPILVVKPDLGTISHTRTAVNHLRQAGVEGDPRIVMTPLDGRPIEQDNFRHFNELYPELPVVGVPRYDYHDHSNLLARLGSTLREDAGE